MKDPRAESKRWLDQARYDLDTSRWNEKGDPFAAACFWARQSAEKAAKAYLYSKGERVVIGHSAAELLERCGTHDKAFKALIVTGAFWDRFYVPARYPNGLPGGIPANAYRKRDSAEAIKTAKRIVGFVSGRLA